MEERNRVRVWLIEDLSPIRLKKKDDDGQPISEDGLSIFAEEIEIQDAEFDIGASEIIVEFSGDAHRLERVLVPVRRRVLKL
jgi:hypothetical protein